MGQQSLIYAFVARGTVVLAEYTEFTGNFTTIAAQCLQKLPASNNKFTYNCDGHTFNYLVEDGFTYCVVAVESVGRQIPIAFLDRVKEDFTKKYGGGKAATAAANSLNREFGSKLKEHMQYCVDHPEEVSKLAKVKAQVSEVKGVMMENIEKVLDRGEKIELLVDKTENLRSQAQDFRQQGHQGAAEDVAPKHEDQADRAGHHHRAHPHHHPVGVPWLQARQQVRRGTYGWPCPALPCPGTCEKEETTCGVFFCFFSRRVKSSCADNSWWSPDKESFLVSVLIAVGWSGNDWVNRGAKWEGGCVV
uniref:Vesicle-associated membrane protein 725 n=1 Tax=Zea mays TaxID=4577 RepID=B6TB83_MAIZE|nr:vesicle-associated membrane protein 725 [Zea mays]